MGCGFVIRVVGWFEPLKTIVSVCFGCISGPFQSGGRIFPSLFGTDVAQQSFLRFSVFKRAALSDDPSKTLVTRSVSDTNRAKRRVASIDRSSTDCSGSCYQEEIYVQGSRACLPGETWL